MSDEMSRLISKFSEGSRKAGDASDGAAPRKDGATGGASGGSAPRTGRTPGLSAFLKPAEAPAAETAEPQAAKEPLRKAAAPVKKPVEKAEEEAWTLPDYMLKGKKEEPTEYPSGALTDPGPEPAYPPEPEPKAKKESFSLFGGAAKRERKEPEDLYATVETAGARPAEKLPLRNGHVGRVTNLKDIPEADVPSKVQRWFTSLFTGVPYTPANAGVTFFLQPEEDDPDGSILEVTAYGNLGLTNNMRLCVQGHAQSPKSIVAHRIERDASADPSRSDWAPVRDRQERSALALWMMIAGIVLLAVLVLRGVLMPLLSWLAVYGAEILVWVIFIAILVFMFRGPRRGGRRWF